MALIQWDEPLGQNEREAAMFRLIRSKALSEYHLQADGNPGEFLDYVRELILFNHELANA